MPVTAAAAAALCMSAMVSERSESEDVDEAVEDPVEDEMEDRCDDDEADPFQVARGRDAIGRRECDRKWTPVPDKLLV